MSTVSGVLYGATNTLVGHPFDTIKTKMQAQIEHFKSHSGYVQTSRAIIRNEGPMALYNGCWPPFFGSLIFRSVQFSVFEMVYTAGDKHKSLKNHIPLTDTEWRVFLGGLCSGSCRSLIECPFEYAKVRG
mmetsp:Transcript_21683/g.15979  ORF Transcript_21683/g.15979 Transcript_21683/m.15979 type:complete len:130 (+) Transcript_21683:57-446(+)